MEKDQKQQTITRNILLIIIAVLALLILLVSNNQNIIPATVSGITEINGLSQPGDNQQQYENNSKNFSLIIPKNLKTTEGENQVDFLSDSGASGITVNIFTDTAQKNTYLTQELCDRFGAEFNKSITKEATAQDFSFQLFKLNNRLGCMASGSVKQGLRQKIYVVLAPDSNKYYAVYYLANNDDEAKTFEVSVNSFRLK